MKSCARYLAAAASILALTGCAGFYSTPITPTFDPAKPPNVGNGPIKADENKNDGILYYMPKKLLAVQIAFDVNGKATVTAPAVSAMPDLSRPFLLEPSNNLVNQNHVVIQVGPNGLLQSAGSNETSGVDTLVKNIAGSLGTVMGLPGASSNFASAATPTLEDCTSSHTYSLFVEPPSPKDGSKPPYPICSMPIDPRTKEKVTVTVAIEALWKFPLVAENSRATKHGEEQPGIFYKSELPYKLTVKTSAAQMEGQVLIEYSPDYANVQFAPVERSYFANNNTTFTLTDGILAKADSDVGGEITAFTALPADAIGAYTNAIGKIFDAVKAGDTDQSGLAAANAQLQLCRATIMANPVRDVSPDQAAANLSLIKAACGN